MLVSTYLVDGGEYYRNKDVDEARGGIDEYKENLVYRSFRREEEATVNRDIFLKFYHTPYGKRMDLILQDILKKAKGGIVIFLSRKGYWLYRTFRKYAGWDASVWENVTVISDRYTAKWKNMEWDGKNFYVVDDTVTSGNSMYGVYRHICICYPHSEVIPVAFFIMNKKRELRRKMEENIPENKLEYLDAFIDGLRAYEQTNSSGIGWLSYEQICLFQMLMIPYVIDLPAVIDASYEPEEEDSEGNHHYAVYRQEEFEHLLAMDGDWKYEDNTYYWDNLLEGEKKAETVHCGFFRCTNPNIYDQIGEGLMQLVIKCRYEMMGEGRVFVVFTPFAILKSVHYEDALKACLGLYEGTPLGEWMSIPQNLQNKETIHVLILRSIVYFFSLYGWKKFCREAGRFLAMDKLKLDLAFLGENSAKPFIDTVRQMEQWEENDFLQRMRGNSIVHKVRQPGIILKKEPAVSYRDFQSAYIMLYKEVIERKRSKIDEGFISIEDLYHRLEVVMQNTVPELRQVLFVKVLLQMLDQSVLGNKIELQEGVIRRGFRYGENSDIALPFYNSYLFFGVRKLYLNCLWRFANMPEQVETAFFDHVGRLFFEIGRRAQKNGYFNILFSERELACNEEYFSDRRGDLGILVENKLFRLSSERRLVSVERDIELCANELMERI